MGCVDRVRERREALILDRMLLYGSRPELIRLKLEGGQWKWRVKNGLERRWL
jgi:hypothetical protein